MVGDDTPLRGIMIRQATVDDIPNLVRLRRVMFEAMGTDDPVKLDAMEKAASTYFARAIPCGEFHGWVAVTPEGETVSVCGVVIDQYPPRFKQSCDPADGYNSDLGVAKAWGKRLGSIGGRALPDASRERRCSGWKNKVSSAQLCTRRKRGGRCMSRWVSSRRKTRCGWK